MSDPILRLAAVTAGYGHTHVLENFSLDVAEHERLAVIGRNGAGKTTLMATIMGLSTLHAGAIRLGGRDISGLAPYSRARLGLGYVPQTRDVFRSLTVEENLRLTCGPGMRLDQAYELFPRLAQRRRNGGAQLSGGEQQMLAIARMFLRDPKVVLLDEPLEGLAPVIRDQLMLAFEKATENFAQTVILVEQHAAAALAFATRAILLGNGRIMFDGSATELSANAELLERHVGLKQGETSK